MVVEAGFFSGCGAEEVDSELCGVVAGYGYLCFLTEHGAAHNSVAGGYWRNEESRK